ncbi:putative alginate lyase [Choanephora cucurbitarum]|nr:putative alginate lyase [Choanephora cucurbitarum]
MGPRRPEVEYISLQRLKHQKQAGVNERTKEAYNCLERLANVAARSGPFSITFHKSAPHIAPSGDPRDFLSYAPYWWPQHPNDSNTKYIRKDGKRNPDIRMVKDQTFLQSFVENVLHLCLGYHMFDRASYAEHAVLLLKTFFVDEKTRMNPNLNYAQLIRGSQNKTHLGRGEGVISSRSLIHLANVLPLLDSFHGYQAIQPAIHAWFTHYLDWLKTSPVASKAARASNNIFSWYTAQKSTIQYFLNPHSSAARHTLHDYFTKTLPKQVDARTGNQPQEAKRAKPFHYLVFNMQAILCLAELGESMGMNVYGQQPLVHLAIKHITTFANSPREDITQAVRCVETMIQASDHDNCCKPFLRKAHQSKHKDKLGGPKNAIPALWSNHV